MLSNSLSLPMVDCTSPSTFWPSFMKALQFHNPTIHFPNECNSGVDLAAVLQDDTRFHGKKVVLLVDNFDELLQPTAHECLRMFLRTFKTLKEYSHLLKLQV